MKDTFKVGDWVSADEFEGAIQYNFCVTEEWLKDGYQVSYFKPWKPKKGEWCVFWFEARNYTVLQYDKTVINDTHPYKDKYGFWESGSDNIAPIEFIDTL